jgi:hypothetical protein
MLDVARAMGADGYFQGEAPRPEGVDYVFYGPMEQAWFPSFWPRSVTTVYRDEYVVVCKIDRRPIVK